MEILFADAHAHSNPAQGLGAAEIAKRFRREGGWFIALIALSPWHYRIDARRGFDAYKDTFKLHIEECRRAREQGLKVACLAGFHPADVDRLRDFGFDPATILELGLKVVEYAAKLCREGLLDGIGEVGRQHYATRPENVAIATEILEETIRLSRDNDCIVHMHLENAGNVTVETIERIVGRTNAAKEKLLFHHAKPKLAAYAIEKGYFATIPGKEQILTYYFAELKGPVDKLLVESDYIDDPRRPCVSSCPWEIVEREKRLYEKKIIDDETLFKINIDNVVSFYRVEPP